ncbi:MAG TPA: HD domain-containing protein [Rhabdochlamydiaceae bacterium]|nr:HD domain-containing protein [Rhabdochlamydiaceae bacterium]
MQRLKQVHQYGVAYYTQTHPEEYTRFDHSLGVFAILRIKGASLEEQIAGLLHDVSHTAFSHVGDWIYAKEHQENDYHSSIHDKYLKRLGIEKILNRHGYQIEQISPKKEVFVMLEQPLPNLCADRIDYNIQGAYFQKFITKEEAYELLADLSFEEGKWLLTNQDLAVKLSNFSLFMTEDCWGSAENFMTSKWLATAIMQGIEAGLFSWDDFQYGIDQTIWDRLTTSQEVSIKKQMEMVRSPSQYFSLVDPTAAETFIKFRCRGIDPWIKESGHITRLSSLNPAFKEAFQRIKQRSIEGWPVRLYAPENSSISKEHEKAASEARQKPAVQRS